MPKKKAKQRGGRREGAGRPRVIPDCTRIMVQLDRSVVDRVNQAASDAGLTLQEALRSAVSNWLRMQGK